MTEKRAETATPHLREAPEQSRNPFKFGVSEEGRGSLDSTQRERASAFRLASRTGVRRAACGWRCVRNVDRPAVGLYRIGK
jgi:hypothetical protein